MRNKSKFIFVTGGVCSSLGKGITAGAVGLLFERQGLKAALLKLDPYLNVDPGTMSPYQHGEVYVTDDGAETDLDLGHYYRFTHSPLSKVSSTSSGQVYDAVLRRERRGDYLGKTVQVIPHITDEIKRRIYACGNQEEDIDVVVVEVGGTVGDIESQPILEAIRQFKNDNLGHCLNIHLTYLPYLGAAKEMKTKPTQHSVMLLRETGIDPNMIVCRSEYEIPTELRDKISLFCNVDKDCVIEELDVKTSVYEVPLQLKSQRVDEILCKKLGLPFKPASLKDWEDVVLLKGQPKDSLEIAIVGKYVEHGDAYKSLYEALDHAATAQGLRLKLRLLESDKIVSKGKLIDEVYGADGYLIPGGFGERGWGGKIMTAKMAREMQVPYFGICLGMQVMCVEFAQNVLHLENANSYEIDPDCQNPIIAFMENQKEITNMGGTMRLGAFECEIKKGSKAHQAYGKLNISERHRHRLEFNSVYREAIEESGLQVTGTLKGGDLCEITELKDHPWMIGVQFHPEFKSRPTEPHPLFSAFIEAALKQKRSPLVKA